MILAVAPPRLAFIPITPHGPAIMPRTIKCTNCDVTLNLPAHALGRRLKCPKCGQMADIPSISSLDCSSLIPQEDEKSGTRRNWTLITLWSIVGAFALGSVLILVWDSHTVNQAKITVAANDRIALATVKANEWLEAGTLPDGEAVEKQLADALRNEFATQKGIGESALSQLRRRRVA